MECGEGGTQLQKNPHLKISPLWCIFLSIITHKTEALLFHRP